MADFSSGQELIAHIRRAFAHREIPAESIPHSDLKPIDSDIEEAGWFRGRPADTIHTEDWQRRPSALFFLTPEAFCYYLPSILILTVQNPQNYPDLAVDAVIMDLDRSPDSSGWDEYFLARYTRLTGAECGALKAWLLFVCENLRHFSWGNAASGPGDTFGRAFDTINLLEKELNSAGDFGSNPNV